MPPTRTLRSRENKLTRRSNTPPNRPSATIQHSSTASHPSIRLTVKAPPSKLRHAVSGAELPPNPYRDQHDSETPDPPPRPSRATRNPRTVVEPDSDDDEEEDDDGEEEVDEDGDEDDEDGDDVDDLAADDSDDDLDMDEPHPPPPVIAMAPVSTTKSKAKPKTNITVAPPPHAGTLKSVEAKEADDDEELSELEEEDELEEDDVEEDDLDSALDDEEGGTRDGTPDLSKLTRRQRAVYDDAKDEGSLMALSNEAQKKKHLTAEEISMRRAEMARRRKNLSEKRNEEEKMDTINKLLKKPAAKRRTRADIIAAQNAADNVPFEDDGREQPKPNALFTRSVQNKTGIRLGVPEEWLEKTQPLGDVLRIGWAGPRTTSRAIEEVN